MSPRTVSPCWRSPRGSSVAEFSFWNTGGHPRWPGPCTVARSRRRSRPRSFRGLAGRLDGSPAGPWLDLLPPGSLRPPAAEVKPEPGQGRRGMEPSFWPHPQAGRTDRPGPIRPTPRPDRPDRSHGSHGPHDPTDPSDPSDLSDPTDPGPARPTPWQNPVRRSVKAGRPVTLTAAVTAWGERADRQGLRYGQRQGPQRDCRLPQVGRSQRRQGSTVRDFWSSHTAKKRLR